MDTYSFSNFSLDSEVSSVSEASLGFGTRHRGFQQSDSKRIEKDKLYLIQKDEIDSLHKVVKETTNKVVQMSKSNEDKIVALKNDFNQETDSFLRERKKREEKLLQENIQLKNEIAQLQRSKEGQPTHDLILNKDQNIAKLRYDLDLLKKDIQEKDEKITSLEAELEKDKELFNQVEQKFLNFQKNLGQDDLLDQTDEQMEKSIQIISEELETEKQSAQKLTGELTKTNSRVKKLEKSHPEFQHNNSTEQTSKSQLYDDIDKSSLKSESISKEHLWKMLRDYGAKIEGLTKSMESLKHENEQLSSQLEITTPIRSGYIQTSTFSMTKEKSSSLKSRYTSDESQGRSLRRRNLYDGFRVHSRDKTSDGDLNFDTDSTISIETNTSTLKWALAVSEDQNQLLESKYRHLKKKIQSSSRNDDLKKDIKKLQEQVQILQMSPTKSS